MAKDNITTVLATLTDGSVILRHADGSLEQATSQTDWARVDAMNDTDIERAMRENGDDADIIDLDWSSIALVELPRKQPISIRLDTDVLDFFRSQGAGYQKRINAVLRTYAETALRPDPKHKRKRPSSP